ncbi:MAG: glycosyltransferase [Proteobacteria bacterium]|nr:glycosyltransferase [Pseudomonadota bacterium]
MRPIDILFVHNNFPAQFRHLAQRFTELPDVRVKAIGVNSAPSLPGVDMRRYSMQGPTRSQAHPFAQRFDLDCRRAEVVLYEASQLRSEGFYPQMIYVHPGWGEALPLRNLFPDANLCSFAEFYYSPSGTDVGFDKEFEQFGLDGEVRISLRNATTLLSLVDSDFAIAPTHWQHSVFPQEFRPKLHVVHDGLEMEKLVPHPGARRLTLSSLDIGAEDELVTFVSRNLEPYRGFHIFMRAIPEILRHRPKARIVLVGGDLVSYGAPPRHHSSWRNYMLEELGDRIDFRRVHFVGKVDYDDYLSLLRRSDAHVYLTYPFVLSWSMLEAMALECLVIGSDTPPVAEVIRNGENGLLVPFFDPRQLAERVVSALAEPHRYAPLRQAARQTILANYTFDRSCWPRHVALLREYCYSTRLVRTVEDDFMARQARISR